MSNVTKLRSAEMASETTIRDRIDDLQSRVWEIDAMVRCVRTAIDHDDDAIEFDAALFGIARSLQALHSDMDSGLVMQPETSSPDVPRPPLSA